MEIGRTRSAYTGTCPSKPYQYRLLLWLSYQNIIWKCVYCIWNKLWFVRLFLHETKWDNVDLEAEPPEQGKTIAIGRVKLLRHVTLIVFFGVFKSYREEDILNLHDIHAVTRGNQRIKGPSASLDIRKSFIRPKH